MTTGQPDRRDPVQAAQELEVVLERLAEADARVDHDALLAHALADRELDALLEEGADVVDDVVVARVVLHRARLAEHVHQAAVAAAIGDEAGQLGLLAEGGHVVDEGGAGVDRGLGNRELGGVDADLHAGAAQGARRRGRRGAAPRRPPPARRRGRVDSPPTSRMSAPSAISARARSTAWSKANHSPPSENESGVTLRMPMTRASIVGVIVGPRPPGARQRDHGGKDRQRAGGEQRPARADGADQEATADEGDQLRAVASGAVGGPCPSAQLVGHARVDERAHEHVLRAVPDAAGEVGAEREWEHEP